MMRPTPARVHQFYPYAIIQIQVPINEEELTARIIYQMDSTLYPQNRIQIWAKWLRNRATLPSFEW